MTKEVTSKKLANALATVAGFFTDMVKSTKDDGEYNRFDYTLRQMLSTMHWKAGKLIEAAETKDIPNATNKALRCAREYDGTEIKELEAARAASYLEKLHEQVAMLQEFRRVILEDVWSNVTETPFSTAPSTQGEVIAAGKSPALDRIRALTAKVGNGNGAPAQDYNSNIERERMN